VNPSGHPLPFRLYLITDRRLMKPTPADAVEQALSRIPAGVAAVQLREPDLSARELLELGRALLPVCRARGAPLLVNDRLDVARALGAEGVHLRRSSVPAAEARAFLGEDALIGASCHSREELQAAAAGATFATLGPVFDTPSKRGLGTPLGLAGFAAALFPGAPPAFALGGITLATGRHALGAGASGLAAIRAVWERDPASQVARLWSILGA
jgi:thiamine-phosphate pyrophosphorylase